MVFQVFRNISGKRSSLPAMTKARRLHYEVMCNLDNVSISMTNELLENPKEVCTNKLRNLLKGSL